VLAEETIQDLERGKLALHPGADPATFILSGGKVCGPTRIVSEPFQAPAGQADLKHVFDLYATTLTPGSKEANSLNTEAVHRRHFFRLMDTGVRLDTLGLDRFQDYVDARAREGVGRVTIRKELATLRVIWSWAFKRSHVLAPPSWKMTDLTFPKTRERPPFQTWTQIARKIERGGLSQALQDELWESLWLDRDQTVECLAWIGEKAARPFLLPMFAFAAYTGARRGEIVRSEREDWDFDAGLVAIRQKKADRSKTFTRRNVPICPELAEIMNAWFANHPGGPGTIATDDGAPIGPRMATKYFRSAVAKGKWAVLHGWHTFRHSLASNLASADVDQRVISEILGHHTEEIERRYRHLLPRKQANALNALFASGKG